MLSLQESIMIHNQEHIRPGDNYGYRRKAVRSFWKAYSQGQRRHRMAAFTRRNSCLQDLTEEIQNKQMEAVHDLGIITVPVNQIVGSENRSLDFDDRFNPVQPHIEDRWIGIAAAIQEGIPLPPVELIRVGERYYVRDGHHRISVARALGQMEIESKVTEWVFNTPPRK